MPKPKVQQWMEVQAESRGASGDADVAARKKPLIQNEDEVTQHDENCAIYTLKDRQSCNCPASRR